MASWKKPTRRQRVLIEKCRLNSNNWLIQKNPFGELHMVHKMTGRKKVIRYLG